MAEDRITALREQMSSHSEAGPPPLKTVPKELQCEWTAERRGNKPVHVCPVCEQWTANLPLYRHRMCPLKNRRKAVGDRRVRRGRG
jgi:hypothetical protein